MLYKCNLRRPKLLTAAGDYHSFTVHVVLCQREDFAGTKAFPLIVVTDGSRTSCPYHVFKRVNFVRNRTKQSASRTSEYPSYSVQNSVVYTIQLYQTKHIQAQLGINFLILLKINLKQDFLFLDDFSISMFRIACVALTFQRGQGFQN